jgi:hypothetical protein
MASLAKKHVCANVGCAYETDRKPDFTRHQSKCKDIDIVQLLDSNWDSDIEFLDFDVDVELLD